MITERGKLALSLTVVSAVLGFMVAMGYRETQSDVGVSTGEQADVEQRHLQSELTGLKQSNALSEQRLADVTAQLTSYERRSAGSSSQLQALQQQLEDERILAGLTPVAGPGVSITLMDGVAVGSNTEDVLTHDWDVRQVINELFTAGAEAVSINDFRVVATSGVYCRGPVVSVNNHRIGAPFTIEAIGDSKALQSALNIQGGILDALRARGVKVSDPQVLTNITMPAFTLTPSTGNMGN